MEDGCSTTECFKGLYADVFHELAKILNFTFKISLVESYGSKLSNNTWNGMIGIVICSICIFDNPFFHHIRLTILVSLIFCFFIGMLIDGSSDFAAASFSQSKARSEVVNYISLNLEEYQQIFIRNPAELYHWEVYTLPLTKNAWLGVIGFVFVIPFLMSIAMIEGKRA